jgi:DNA-binding NarL/FixJ family response regulator
MIGSFEGTPAVIVGCSEALLCRGVIDALQQDCSARIVDGGTSSGDLEARVCEEVAARSEPLVVVVDDKVEHSLLLRFRAMSPSPRALILLDAPSPLYATLLIAAGVWCIARDTSSAGIRNAVRAAARGDRPTWAAAAGGDAPSPHAQGFRDLTRRETEVLRELSRGRSASETAAVLGISTETVRTHTARIRRKLKVKSKRELIGLALPTEPLTRHR